MLFSSESDSATLAPLRGQRIYIPRAFAQVTRYFLTFGPRARSSLKPGHDRTQAVVIPKKRPYPPRQKPARTSLTLTVAGQAWGRTAPRSS
jgi:hypothetical protein